MKTFENIPAGYQIHIKTWENDGDAYKTQIVSGLTDVDVYFYIAIAEMFQSKNSHKIRGLGNGAVKPATLREMVSEVLKTTTGLSKEIRQKWEDALAEDDEDQYCCITWELLCEEILGFPVSEYYSEQSNFCRAYDSVKVYYYPEEVSNVTDRFVPVK